MKIAVNIIGIVFSIIFLIVIAYYIGEVSDARMQSIFSSYSASDSYYSSYTPYSYSSDSYSSITEEGGIVSMFFFLFFIFQFIFNLKKVKTTTSKVLSIIGLSFAGIFILWDLLMISDGGSLSFDEVGVGFVLFCLISFSFSIIGLVQSFVHDKKMKSIQ